MTALGHAVLQGSDPAINRYATPELLDRAPAHHLINSLGMQNLPTRFIYTVDFVDSARATATITWIFGRSVVVDRLSWLKTDAGWRIADVAVVSA